MKIFNRATTAIATAITMTFATPVFANECADVSFSDPGWTAETATTAMSGVILEALGYNVDIKVLSVPVTYTSLASGDIDIFLGNWMPSQETDIRPYLDKESIEIAGVVVEGAKYTLATNAAGAELGIKDFADIAKHKEALNGEIIGIEPGNEGNRLVLGLIEKNEFDLADFKVKVSSEQGMLAQVARLDSKGKPVIFLGWAPHPMNDNFDMTYLTGGDTTFGPDFGAAVVNSVVTTGYLDKCPNVGQFVKNLSFTIEMENAWMASILEKGETPEDTVKTWLKSNPEILDTWLKDVKTIDGGDALAAVTDKLVK